MRHLPVAASVLLGTAAGLSGRVGTPVPPEKPNLVVAASAEPVRTPTAPALVFDEIAFDFGEVLDTARVAHAFPFVNAAGVTVHPVHESPCGLTASFDKTAYAPGERGVLHLVPSLSRRAGPLRKTWTGRLRERPGETMRITLAGTVIPVVELRPQWVQLDEVRKGDGAAQRVWITGLGADFDILAAEVEGDSVTAEIGVPRSLSRGSRDFRALPVDVTISPDAPPGCLKARIHLTTTSKERPSVQIFVEADIVGEMRATVPVIMLPAAGPGREFSGSAGVSSRAGLPFLVTSVDVERQAGPDVEVEWQPAVVSGAIGYEVTVRGKAPHTTGAFRGTLVVRTDRRDEEPLRIGYYGQVRDEQPKGRCGNDRHDD